MIDNNNSTDHIFYSYKTNKQAPIAFGYLYVISFAVLLLMVFSMGFAKMSLFRSWRKLDISLRYYSTHKLIGAYIPLLIGVALEVIGYGSRSVSVIEIHEISPYILSTILILLAPAFYAASIYMLFGRLTHLLFAEKILIMPAKFNTAIFVLGDIASLLMQTFGGAMMAQPDSVEKGKKLASAGLYVQLGFFGLFIINESVFYIRVKSVKSDIHKRTNIWKFTNFTLLFSSILILIRSIVRTIEFGQGDDGYITNHEWCLYTFDGMLMLLVGIIFILTMPFYSIFSLQAISVDIQIDEALAFKEDQNLVFGGVENGTNDYVLTEIDESTKQKFQQ